MTLDANEKQVSLHARRLDSDYGDFVEITAHDAKDSLSKAQTFVRTVETLSESIIRENDDRRF